MKYFLSILLLLLFSIATYSKNNKDSLIATAVKKRLKEGNQLNFIENKGQMADMQGRAANNLLFKASSSGADVYITTNGISYVFIKLINPIHSYDKFRGADETDSIQYCRADMELVGAAINKENISRESVNSNYSNYFLSQCPSGIMNVHSYEKLTIKNIYPGIDWVLYVKDKTGLEYDFIVHANADPSLIKLRYKWTDLPKLQKNGSLKINTPLGNIIEGVPVSYEGQNERKEIKTDYVLHNNEIGFKVSNYDKSNTIIIDPALVWATFYGGSIEEGSFSLSCDSDNVWVAGSTLSINFPVLNPSNGAYFQGKLAGSNDAFILDFSKSSVLKYATYYGGSGRDEAYAISSDNKNVWVTGYTGSSDLPTLNLGGGAYYQNSLAGKYNVFLLQFNLSGILKWATYYGGSSDDYGESINTDGNNVWITGFTNSTNFPVLNPGGGAYYQPNYGGGAGDAFILKFNTAGICSWATYYGGSNDDRAYSINSDGVNAWLTGYTSSTDFSVLNPGGGAYFQGANSSGKDLFLLKFNLAGVCKWATYYGGGLDDIGYCINSDGQNIWVTGSTNSTDFPLLNPGGGAYFLNNNLSSSGGTGSNDIFILKFNTSGICKWSTYYGGYSDDFGYSINSDGSRVWVTGYTWTQNYPNGSPWFYLLNPGNGAFFQSPATNGGNPGGDNCFVLEFTTSGICKWATWYGTLGEAHGQSIQSDGYNVWLTGEMNHTDGTLPTMDPGGGAYFQDTIVGGYLHQNTNTVIIAKFTACGSPDIAITPDSAKICIGDSVRLIASEGTSYLWSPATGLSTTNGDSTDANPANTTNYIVSYIAGKCKGVDTVPVIVYPKPVPSITPNQAICKGNKLDLNATGGIRYFWNPPTGLNNDTIADPVSNPASTIAYTVTISNQACSVKDSVSITVNPIPVITVCCNASISGGQSVAISATPVVNSYTYLWQPETGLSCATCANTMASPYTTTTYSVLVTDSLGCDTTGSVTIDVNCDAFVPEAFSPNGDGQNDLLYVRGDCIKTIDFMVFDRWGNKIFETTDKAMGWNGNYKGEAMNTGTYVYYLTATKYDGSSIDKKGNVTLVR